MSIQVNVKDVMGVEWTIGYAVIVVFMGFVIWMLFIKHISPDVVTSLMRLKDNGCGCEED